ncbi:MAG: SpoIIE family protein phosphatase [Clostridia bacterium]|nr:SpoIIE family protein phosphatase [Ruminococcus sp.]MBQ3969580.1 SpoIIE family protein phosphatase [Clostridia bacterium]
MRAIQLRGRNLITDFFEKSVSNSIVIRFAYFLCGVVVSRGAVFGNYAPFGASFCAAVPYENSLSAALGAILGYILMYPKGSFRYVASVITIFALRWMLNDIKAVSQSRLFAPLAAMVPLSCTGIVIILVSYNDPNDIIMCLTEALLAGVGAYFLNRTILLTVGSRGISTYNQQEIACLVMTGCIFLLSANSITAAGISLGRILAVTAILFCAYYGSVAGGCIGGVSTGIVFGIGSEEFGLISACYGFGGMMAGLLSYVGRFAAAAAFVICSGIISLRNPITVQTAASFYETLIASAIFLLIPKEIANRISAFVTPHTGNANGEGLRRSVIMRLDLAANAIKNISQAVNCVALKLKEYYSADEESIYTKCIEENCSRCGMRAFCWQDPEERREDRFADLTPILKDCGEIDSGDIKNKFSSRCCKSEEMANSINRNYDSYKSFLSAESRVTQIRGVVAGQFGGLGDILADLKEEFDSFESYDTAASERICAYLRSSGFVPIECSCRTDKLGRMTVELELADTDRKLLKKSSLSKEISKLCSRTMNPPQISVISNKSRAVFTEKPKFDIQIGSSQHICSDSNLCGDSFNYFNDGQGRFVAMISDGMGTGGRAAVDASMAVSIMTKLLKVGFGCDCALSVTNSALMVKSQDESLATVDVMSFDLFSGEAEIMKAGAPITFIRQSGKILRIEPTSLPAGILSDIKFTHDSFSLKEGDLIVMLSDGAISISDQWIGSMMRDFDGDEIQELVNDIIDEATIGSKLGRDDDITVLGVRVVEN